MGVVLAIDPGRRQGPALERLSREFDTHEVVIATSGDEALAVLDDLLPDLIVFPVCFAPGEETKLQARLDGLPNPQDRRALSLPLRALLDGEARSARPIAVPPRWFYWFKPQTLAPETADPQAFADAVRADVDRPRTPLMASRDPVAPPATVPTPPTQVEPTWPHEHQRHQGADAEAAATAAMHSVSSMAPAEAGAFLGSMASADATLFEPSGETAVDEAQASATGARAAAIAGVLRNSVRGIGRGIGGAGSALRAAWRFSQGWPRPVQIGVPVTIILLTLGMTGQVEVLFSAPMRWASAARDRWFPEKSPTGTAEIQTVPEGAQVWYQGRQLGVTPLRAELAVGSHEVELRYRNTTRTLTLDVTPGNTIVQRIEWAAPRVAGKLRVESDPSGAAVVIDGKPRGVTPLNVDDLTAGRHEVDVTMNGNTQRETVEVKGGKTVTLRTSIYQGWLALFSPIDLKLVVDGRAITLDDQNRAMLPSGAHQLTVQNRALGYEHTQSIDIKPGDTTPVSVVLPKTTLSVTTSSPADVWVDGERVGEAPIADYPVDIGTRAVLVRSAEHGERHATVTATVDPARVSFDFASAAP